MKNLQNLVYVLITLSMLGVLMTSCEREMIVIEDIDGLKTNIVIEELDGLKNDAIEPPLTLEELDAIWGEDQPNEENIESRANCKCKSVYASRRNNTSSYVYCKKRQNSSSDVVYFLDGPGLNGYGIHDGAYYHTYDGMVSGEQYDLLTVLICDGGGTFLSNHYIFTQNGNYPPPHVY